MAAHIREQITAAVVTAVTGLTTTGTNVFRERDTDAEPLAAGELPGLVVNDAGGDAQILSLGISRKLERHLRLSIAAHVKTDSGYGTTLNLILKEIEVALAGASLGGAKYGTIVEEAAREIAGGGDTNIARQAFTFEFIYYTTHNTPDVAG